MCPNLKMLVQWTQTCQHIERKEHAVSVFRFEVTAIVYCYLTHFDPEDGDTTHGGNMQEQH